MLTRPSKRSLRKAFTLLELIVVIVILGILAALAIPTFARVIERARQSTAEAAAEATGREAIALAAFRDGTLTAADLNEALGDTNGKVVGKTALSGSTAVVTVGTGSDAVDVTLTFTGNSVDGVAGAKASGPGGGTTTPTTPVNDSGISYDFGYLRTRVPAGADANVPQDTWKVDLIGKLAPRAGESVFMAFPDQLLSTSTAFPQTDQLTWTLMPQIAGGPWLDGTAVGYADLGALTSNVKINTMVSESGVARAADVEFTFKAVSAKSAEEAKDLKGSLVRVLVSKSGVVTMTVDGASSPISAATNLGSHRLSSVSGSASPVGSQYGYQIRMMGLKFNTLTASDRVAVRHALNTDGTPYTGSAATPPAWSEVKYITASQGESEYYLTAESMTDPDLRLTLEYSYGAGQWRTVVVTRSAQGAMVVTDNGEAVGTRVQY